MNKNILVGALYGNAGLDGILKPIRNKAAELTKFAENNRNLAIAKRQEAERLQAEAVNLETEAERAYGISIRITDML